MLLVGLHYRASGAMNPRDVSLLLNGLTAVFVIELKFLIKRAKPGMIK